MLLIYVTIVLSFVLLLCILAFLPDFYRDKRGDLHEIKRNMKIKDIALRSFFIIVLVCIIIAFLL